jgi:limonene-1,2-epoxide hydrolase
VNVSSLVGRLHEGFNDRDVDAWSEVFDEDVELVVDGGAFRGVAAARAYVTGVFREFPGLRIHGARIVAERGNTIVAEHQLLNGNPSLGPLRPQGSVCEIYRVRDARVVAYRSYYAAEQEDREDVVNVPSRAGSVDPSRRRSDTAAQLADLSEQRLQHRVLPGDHRAAVRAVRRAHADTPNSLASAPKSLFP